MSRPGSKRSRCLAAIGLSLLVVACGKKAPLRLPDSRAPENAPALQARVSDGQVILDFRVPRRRLFPEREEPWVLVRILRKPVSSPDYVEVGAILESGGFTFDSSMTWRDQSLPPPSSFEYRVEFRDAKRRRRALSEPLAVAWERVPGAPFELTATGGVRVIGLAWKPPIDVIEGNGYRVYRREQSLPAAAPITPEPVSETRFIDSRVEAGSDYCYTVRSVITVRGLEVEGPASLEVCSRPTVEAPPPATVP